MFQVIDSNGNIKNVVISSTTIGSAINAVSAGTAAITSGTIIFSNSNGVSFGANGQTITASFSNAAGGGAAISAGGNSQSTGTVIFSNSNGLTFGLNAGTLTASHNGLTSQSNQAFSAQGGSSAFQTLSFNNANGVSFSNNGGAIEATVKTDYLTTARASNDGIGLNTAQSNVTWSVNSSGLSIDARGYAGTGTTFGGTNVSASATLNSNGLALSLSAPSAAAASVNFSAGSTSNNLASVVFNNSNGVSFGLNAGTITATVKTDYLTTAMQSDASTQFVQANAAFNGTNASGTIASNGISVSVANASNSSWTVSDANTSMTIGRLAFTNSNGITMTLSTSNNGNATLFASHNGLTSQSNQAVSGSNGSFEFQTVSFGNLNGLSFYSSNGSMVGSYTVPNTAGLLSAINVSAGTTSGNTSAVTFSNSNGITFGFNGGTITASHNGLTTAMASNASTQFVQANAAFAGTNASGTIASNGISISVNSGGGASNLSITGGNGSSLGSVSQMYFSNANSMTFGLSTSNNGSVTITAAYEPTNTEGLISQINISAGSTSLNLQSFTLGNSNSISFGLNSANSVVTASYQPEFNSYFQYSPNYIGTTAFTMGGSSNFVQPFILPFNISASYIRIANSFAFGSTTGGTTANTSLTLNNSQSIWVNIYTKGVGASSKSLQFLTSGSVSLVFQVRVHIGAASNNQTVSHNFTYPSSEGAAQGNFATNYNVNAASYNVSTTHLTSFNGFRWLDIPFAASLSAGDYWMAIAQSTATATSGAIAAMTNLTARNTYVAVSQINTNVALMGVSSNMSTAGWLNGLGYWSTNVLGSSSSSIGLASVSTVANQPIMPFQLIREA